MRWDARHAACRCPPPCSRLALRSTPAGRGSTDDCPSSVSTAPAISAIPTGWRSEEHTSELQSLMRISYAVFCLKKKRTSYLENKIHSLTHQSSLATCLLLVTRTII